MYVDIQCVCTCYLLVCCCLATKVSISLLQATGWVWLTVFEKRRLTTLLHGLNWGAFVHEPCLGTKVFIGLYWMGVADCKIVQLRKETNSKQISLIGVHTPPITEYHRFIPVPCSLSIYWLSLSLSPVSGSIQDVWGCWWVFWAGSSAMCHSCLFLDNIPLYHCKLNCIQQLPNIYMASWTSCFIDCTWDFVAECIRAWQLILVDISAYAYIHTYVVSCFRNVISCVQFPGVTFRNVICTVSTTPSAPRCDALMHMCIPISNVLYYRVLQQYHYLQRQ